MEGGNGGRNWRGRRSLGITTITRTHFLVSLWLSAKEPVCNAEDMTQTLPELAISPREGKGNEIQYSCLENPTDRGA